MMSGNGAGWFHWSGSKIIVSPGAKAPYTFQRLIPRLKPEVYLRATLAILIVLLLAGCGGGSNSSSNSGGGNTIASSNDNVQPVTVTLGPANNYNNGIFTSVTVCVPGTSNCQTVDNVLVDTGSSGLRLISSALTIPLPQQTGLAECMQFQDGFVWGPLASADIKISGEQAPSATVQVMGVSGFAGVPSACSNSGGVEEDTVEALGANGVLGIGPFRQDCGGACAQPGTSNPGVYYSCTGNNCGSTAVGLGQQVQNPVFLFPQDNNGSIIQLPAVPAAGAATLAGSLVFGIGTQSNNALGSVSVYTLDGNGNFTTTYNGNAYNQSFIDTGSNGYFFLDTATTGMPECHDNSGFYCPTSPVNFSATNQGTNGVSGVIQFTISSADTQFNTNNAALSQLGGTNPGSFDWGLPFFFGRNVYTAVELQSTPGGVGPYFAY